MGDLAIGRFGVGKIKVEFQGFHLTSFGISFGLKKRHKCRMISGKTQGKSVGQLDS
jgi:hypothetical protein